MKVVASHDQWMVDALPFLFLLKNLSKSM